MPQWRVNRVVLCTGDLLYGDVMSCPPFGYYSVQCDLQVVRYWRSRGYDRYTPLSCGRRDRRAIPSQEDARHQPRRNLGDLQTHERRSTTLECKLETPPKSSEIVTRTEAVSNSHARKESDTDVGEAGSHWALQMNGLKLKSEDRKERKQHGKDGL